MGDKEWSINFTYFCLTSTQAMVVAIKQHLRIRSRTFFSNHHHRWSAAVHINPNVNQQVVSIIT
jgi:hypothetical protein